MFLQRNSYATCYFTGFADLLRFFVLLCFAGKCNRVLLHFLRGRIENECGHGKFYFIETTPGRNPITDGRLAFYKGVLYQAA